MQYFTKWYPVLIISTSTTIVFFLVYLPSQAQNQSNNQGKRTVRVTTGIQQVSGWEQGLIKANPNLARWHWDPIYSYKQGYATITPESAKSTNGIIKRPPAGNPGRPAYHYNIPAPQDNRPQHIQFSDQALKEVQARYSRPPINPLPAATPIRQENASGQLSNKETQAAMVPSSGDSISTYGQMYKRQEIPSTALKYNLQKTSVYGQLLNTNAKVRYNSAKVVKHKGK
jgi:hypothetical protein